MVHGSLSGGKHRELENFLAPAAVVLALSLRRLHKNAYTVSQEVEGLLELLRLHRALQWFWKPSHCPSGSGVYSLNLSRDQNMMRFPVQVDLDAPRISSSRKAASQKPWKKEHRQLAEKRTLLIFP